MSQLWPEGKDGTLIELVTNYLRDLSQNEIVDQDTCDSLAVAVDCLSSITQSDNVTVNNDLNLSLVSMYNQCKGSNNNNINNNNNETESKESNLSAEEISQRVSKFEKFVTVLKSKNFFKNSEEGSEEYLKLLDTARQQWNTRFPQFSLNSLDMITNNNNNDNKEYQLDPEKANQMKAEGNAALQKKDFATAIVKYSEAIRYNPNNAVFYSNRSAAYCYTKDYQKAANDARKATEVDPKYVKAWVRLGVSEFELENYEASRDAYNEALQLTPSTDKNWELYMDRVQQCEQKLGGDDVNVDDDINGMGPMGGMGGGNNPMGGGMPDMSQLGNLLGGMGGAGGAGGAGGGGGGQPDFNNFLQNMGGMDGILNNPMFAQMAQNLMKDPNMMQNLSNMMGNPQTQAAMNNMFSGGGGPNGNGDDNGGDNEEAQQMKESMQKLLQNPEKAQRVMSQAMEDDEVKALMNDPEVAPLVTRLKTGDYSALIEASKKPELMKTVKKLMKKYMDE